MRFRSLQKFLFEVLEKRQGNRWKPYFDEFLVAVILLNVIVIILESIDQVYFSWRPFFLAFEIFTVLVFTFEYLCRVWVSTLHTQYSHPVFGRIRYLLHPLLIIDLLSILPFYLIFFFPGFQFSRILQILRLFRIFKLERYFQEWEDFLTVIRKKKKDLKIALYILGILLLLTSSILYFIENPLQPDKFSSIPASAWWAIVTLTTVGYGDTIPFSPLGKVFAGLTAIMGVAIFALPAAIISAGFVHHAFSKNEFRCPHCKKLLLLQKEKKKVSWLSKIMNS